LKIRKKYEEITLKVFFRDAKNRRYYAEKMQKICGKYVKGFLGDIKKHKYYRAAINVFRFFGTGLLPLLHYYNK